MTAAVLTPFTAAEAVELGNRIWRRQILPVGDVNYKGRVLHFTKDYLRRLARSFKDGAYPQVPFQLADHENRHTNDPERTRGEITAMEALDDGLWVTAEVSERGDALLRENPKLGVSARIVEDYDRADGKFFPAAVQHVLGTLDPRISWMGGKWEAIEAASPEPDRVIDLSGSVFVGGEASPDLLSAGGNAGADPEGGAPVADLGNLTGEQQARLAQLLDLPDDTLDALAAGGVVLTPDELDALTAPGDEDGDEDGLAAEIGAMSDDDIAALEAELEAELDAEGTETIPEGEPVSAGLSAEAQFAIDLATARAEETQREMAVIQSRLREQDYQAEKRKLADLGVPPYITDLARPLLEGAGRTVELANGKTADAGQIVRRVLAEYAQQARLLDLDVELGSPMDEPDDAAGEQQAASRGDLVSRFKSMTGL